MRLFYNFMPFMSFYSTFQPLDSKCLLQAPDFGIWCEQLIFSQTPFRLLFWVIMSKLWRKLYFIINSRIALFPKRHYDIIQRKFNK
jgi:hypothetical protein